MPVWKRAPADLGTAGPNGLTRGEFNEATGQRKGSRVEWCPRNASELEFQSVAYRRESASRAPKLEDDPTKNNLLQSEDPRV
jgi:hypothetical protein